MKRLQDHYEKMLEAAILNDNEREYKTYQERTEEFRYTVMLEGDTSGTLISRLTEEELLGSEQTVSTCDENGMTIECTGIVIDVAEINKY